MQVFVPYSDYQKSVESLDSRRLRKQLLEATQLLDIMFGLPTKSGKPRTGWLNHPCLTAWKQTPGALIEYTLYALEECKKREFKTDYYSDKLKEYSGFTTSLKSPVWLGDEEIHSSHRARLLQKGWEEKIKGQKTADDTIVHYKNQNWSEMFLGNFFDLEYIWPVNISADSYDKEMKVSKNALKMKSDLVSVYGMNPW